MFLSSLPWGAMAGNTPETPQTRSVPALSAIVDDRISMYVAPVQAPAGVPRTVFLSGCTGAGAIDESAIVTGVVYVRISPNPFNCGFPVTQFNMTFTPQSAGTIRVVLRSPQSENMAETSLTVTPRVRSAFNVEGMWYDPATDGSGISIFHNSNSDSAFGTWFLYDRSSSTWWFSLQNLNWTGNGKSAEGLIYQVTAAKSACAAGATECVKRAEAVEAAGSFRVNFTDTNTARIEAIDRRGNVAFVSNLRRLGL
jgi:hypothetical protein